MVKHGKKYVEASKSIEKNKFYTASEAIEIVKNGAKRNFDETVEVAINLNIDAKKTDMNVRGTTVLPNGTGKTKKVLVITKNFLEDAKNSGADYYGNDEYLQKIEKESWFDFDTIVASPEMMISLGKIGKILGPKGLMPNPKLGTVTTNIKDAVSNIKKGQVEFKNDSNGIVHTIIGKKSFESEALLQNLKALVNEIIKSKPNGVKGEFVKSISISSSMGCGIKIEKNSFDK